MMESSPSAAIIVACPHDAALNRVPTEKLDEAPRCGTCGQALFEACPVTLTSKTFDRHASKADLPLLIDFWAAWCGPCRTMSPNFEAAAARLEPRVRLGTLDTEAEPGLAARYAIRGIPALILVRHGREIARTSGVMPTSAIIDWTTQHLLTRR